MAAMFERTFVLGLILLSATTTFGQDLVKGWTVVHRKAQGRVFVGPIPDRPSDLLLMLKERQIQNELKLSDVQLTALALVGQNEFRRRISIAELNQIESDRRQHNLESWVDETKRLSFEQMDEVLSPAQFTRLIQLVHRAEIALVGYSDAFTTGRTHDAIGIHENQLTHLRDRIDGIMRTADEEAIQIKSETELELLSVLTPEQLRTVSRKIGPVVDVRASLDEQLGRLKILGEIANHGNDNRKSK